MGIFYIILFYVLCSFVSLAMIYSDDIADISRDDFEDYVPSIEGLEAEERTNTYKVDDYIKENICPRYYHQKLKEEVEYYQNKHTQHYYLSTSVIHLFLYVISAQLIVKAKIIENFAISYLIAIIIGIVCYCIVKFIYKKHWWCRNIRIENFYGLYSSYSWDKHCRYLISIKQSVIFRYALRKVFEFISFWIYLLFFFNVPD